MMKRIISLARWCWSWRPASGRFLYVQSGGSSPQFRLARVERGSLTAAVSATGNLAAVITVQVGSQVSGQVKELLVDFNSVVKRNQLIARIDPETFQAKVSQARAEVESAQATVLNQQAQIERARADVETARAGLAEAKAQTARAQVAVLDTKRDLGRKSELSRESSSPGATSTPSRRPSNRPWPRGGRGQGQGAVARGRRRIRRGPAAGDRGRSWSRRARR